MWLMSEEEKNSTVDKRSNYEPTALAKNIRPLVKKALGRNGLVQIELLSRWPEIVGEDLAAYCFPDKIEFQHNQKNNGIIYLTVPAGAFALEIKHREPQILAKVNAYFGYQAVCCLKILQNNEMQFNVKKSREEKKESPLLVSDEEQSYIKEISGQVKDEKLKEILIKLGYAVFSDKNQK